LGVADVGPELDRIAEETGFSGAVRVADESGVIVSKAWGLADRAHGVANSVDTRFAIASGSKGLTALAVVSLIEDGSLDWSTAARAILGTDLPLVDDRVTVEHLLGHTSGIGDYLDDDLPVTEYVLGVRPHELVDTEDYLAILDGLPQKSAPGDGFSYCNGGYVVLALLAERASGVPFHELVRARVCEPAGMRSSAYLRSDELPGDAAIGYLDTESPRTNVFHLPVRGNGDGGMYATLADVHALWRAVFEARVVSRSSVERMTRPRSSLPSGEMRYGLGFWLRATGSAVVLEGADAGVSFRSVSDPASGLTHTVVSNTSDGAWPLARYLDALTDRASSGHLLR
jgi:CubicO group peptidase (beta-lactamase class C family)